MRTKCGIKGIREIVLLILFVVAFVLLFSYSVILRILAYEVIAESTPTFFDPVDVEWPISPKMTVLLFINPQNLQNTYCFLLIKYFIKILAAVFLSPYIFCKAIRLEF